MKVGIATERIHGPVNGPRQYRIRLCEQLVSDPRIEPIFFSFSNKQHPLYDRSDTRHCLLPRFSGLTEWKLRKLDLDVIHLDAALHRFPFISRLSTPTVATIHGIEPVVLSGYDCSRRTKIQKRYIWPRLAAKLDRIIAVSQSGKEQLVEHYPVQPDRVDMVYNGIDHDVYRPVDRNEQERVQERYDFSEPYFLTVNSYSARKNPATLFKAFDRIADRTGHQLVIVGPGWEADPVKSLIRECRHNDRIVRLGSVPETDLPGLYTGATCTVTSTIHENFGLPLAESMACGTPVVASAVYAVPEVVGDGGLLVEDPNDIHGFASAMERLVDGTSERARLAEQAQSTAREFTWDRCGDETITVYESVVAEE